MKRVDKVCIPAASFSKFTTRPLVILIWSAVLSTVTGIISLSEIIGGGEI